jgi:hypothetical protein
MAVGFAVVVTEVTAIGTVTVTVADALALPPVPEQLIVYVVVAVGVTVTVPFVVTDPVRPAVPVQLVALVVATVSTEDAPSAIDTGLAVSDAVGAGVPPPPPKVPPPPPQPESCSAARSTKTDDAIAFIGLRIKSSSYLLNLNPIGGKNPPSTAFSNSTFARFCQI